LNAGLNSSLPLLRVEGVTLQYETGQRLIRAAYRASFNVLRSDRFVILGPSGCGKSTILKAVGGYIQPVEGRILLDGSAISAPGPDRVFVFQEFDQLLPWKTVRENIVFALTAGKRLQRNEALERASHFIGKVNLTDFADSHPHTLSGGMKQRVAIARSLALRPDVLLMDEPFGALDAQTRIILQEDISRICREQNLTVLMITHAVEEAVFMSDRVLVMTARPGQIKEDVEIEGREAWRGGAVDDAYTSERFAYWRERIWSSVRQEIASPRAA
jgi:NitT/TauT family transport system ATP-binding protein